MAAEDVSALKQEGLDSPARHAAAVTPHDTNELTAVTRGVWVGVGGDVAVTTVGGESVTIVGVQAGTMLPIRVKIIKNTATTATDMLAWW